MVNRVVDRQINDKSELEHQLRQAAWEFEMIIYKIRIIELMVCNYCPIGMMCNLGLSNLSRKRV